MRPWVGACALGEAVGMTAAAGAASIAEQLPEGLPFGWLAALGVVVVGGLVEGATLGTLQGRALRRVIGEDAGGALVARWAGVTTLVAGLGWAAASAPSVLASDGGSGRPPLVVVLAAAGVLGAGMGLALGSAQAAVLRGLVARPWRWPVVSAVAWTPAMVVIFLGATTPSGSWPWQAVVPLGMLTGLVAGSLLGVVSGAALPTVDGHPASNLMALRLLSSRAHGLADGSLIGLRVTGVLTGRTVELPVQYAADHAGFVVLPGHAESKRWWRNLRSPADVEILHGGAWCPGRGEVLLPGDAEYDDAAATYLRSWPRTSLGPGQPLVRVRDQGHQR